MSAREPEGKAERKKAVAPKTSIVGNAAALRGNVQKAASAIPTEECEQVTMLPERPLASAQPADQAEREDTQDIESTSNTQDTSRGQEACGPGKSVQKIRPPTKGAVRANGHLTRGIKASSPATPAPVPRSLSPLVQSPHRFRPMLQGTGTNQFSQVSTRRKAPDVDAITGLARIEEGSLTVFVEQYDSLTGGLRVSTHKLLDACTIQLTAQNHYRGDGPLNTLVTIPLDDYMEQCGIPLTKASKDKTRRKVKEDLEALYSTSLEWNEPSGQGDQRDYAKMRIISMHSIRAGKIQVRFSEDMARYLTHAYVMQYSLELFRLDERNPSAYHLGKRLLLHASIDNNQKRGTANIISVKSLLASAPDIPSYEEVMQKDRHLDQRIITPFENALSALSGVLSWDYTNAKGQPLSPKQRERFDYNTFIRCYISFGGAAEAEDDMP